MIRRIITFLISMIPAVLIAQMETDGAAPTSLYKKFPFEFQFTPVAEVVRGDEGWFDDYLNDFIIDHTGRMWIAGNDGLSYSDDKGLNWHYSTSKYATFSIFETRKHTLLSSSNNEFLLRSDDNGKNWHTSTIKDMGTGKSSHGERYDDIFYVQADSQRIIRTTQYSTTLLLSDDDGKSWKKKEAPDDPVSITNIGDSLLVMFTYDEMYISTDRGNSWDRKRKGLPKSKEAEESSRTGPIDCGVVMQDGTIMALLNSKEDATEERYAYFFNLATDTWSRDPYQYKYSWTVSSLNDGGNNRLFSFDYNRNELAVSFDLGKTWGVLWNTDDQYAYPFHFRTDGNSIYFISRSTVSVIHFPETCASSLPPATRQTFFPDGEGSDKVELFPVTRTSIENRDEFGMYQLCSSNGKGYSRFLLHIPRDTSITEINILKNEAGLPSYVQTFTAVTNLPTGDYELWYYNMELKGCYFLNVVFKGGKMEDEWGTGCYFY